jgi:hypothetical protein
LIRALTAWHRISRASWGFSGKFSDQLLIELPFLCRRDETLPISIESPPQSFGLLLKRFAAQGGLVRARLPRKIHEIVGRREGCMGRAARIALQ